ncbi:MAG: hypothetical protein V1689_13220 [Pseudomonadota bacterium]
MAKVSYETGEALFEFDLIRVTESLEYLAFEQRADEAFDLLDLLSSDRLDFMKIPEEKHYFEYIVLDLLNRKEGSVKCKQCDTTYSPDELKQVISGHGKEQFSADSEGKRGIKALFGKRRKPSGVFRGLGLQCPEGHELISMTSWRA